MKDLRKVSIGNINITFKLTPGNDLLIDDHDLMHFIDLLT